MEVCKGGRGIKALYQTILIRIPIELKDKISELSNRYKYDISNNNSVTSYVTGNITQLEVINKGGRGVKASYETITARIPKPIKSTVLELVSDYRKSLSESKPVTSYVTSIDKQDTINLAREIIKQKKSAKLSLEKLLQTLLQDNNIKL